MEYQSVWTSALISTAALSEISSFADDSIGESLLVLLDFDSVHAIVMCHCARRAPHTTAAANRAFTLWKVQHQLAQHELQVLARQRITAESRQGMSPAELDYTIAMLRSAGMIKLGKDLALMDEAAIKQYCEDYPANLQSAAMDFSSRWLQAQQRQSGQEAV